MAGKNRWFVKRGTKVNGPFLQAHITQYILLGRIRDDDELSQDQENWQPTVAFKELYPDVLLEEPRDEEKIKAERIKYDERIIDRRADKLDQSSNDTKKPNNERREKKDRRQIESEEIISHRETKARVMDSLVEGTKTHDKTRPFVYLAIVLLLILIIANRFQASDIVVSADCAAPAADNINWMNCNKFAADLSNQTLSYANLRNVNFQRANLLGAKLLQSDMSYSQLNHAVLANATLQGAHLKGADLRAADLTYANFENADLNFADLTGADIGGIVLKNASLNQAIWVDGRVCSAESVGECRFD